MVGVDVSITKRVDKLTAFQAAHLSEHARKEGIARYIKRNTES